MRVIFLDIDGVLNTDKNYSEYGKAQSEDPNYNPKGTEHIDVLHRYIHLLFDKLLVENLNSIIAETGAHIVVSSSWRMFYTGRDGGPEFHHLAELLGQVGIKGKVLGRTPRNLNRRFADSIPRGFEIYAWLDCHPNVKSYVILDDDEDMLSDQELFFVKTNGSLGLTASDARRAIKILNS